MAAPAKISHPYICSMARAFVTFLFLPPPVIASLLILLSLEIRLIRVSRLTLLLFRFPYYFRLNPLPSPEVGALSKGGEVKANVK